MINKNIKCPSCHNSFNIEENAYAEIRSQIKDIEIESSVSKRVDELISKQKIEIKLAKEETKNEMQKIISDQEQEISSLTIELDNTKEELDKDQSTAIALAKEETKNEMQKIISDQEQKISSLTVELDNTKEELDKDQSTAIALAKEETKNEMQKIISLQEVDIEKYKNQVINNQNENEIKLKNLKTQYDLNLKDVEDEFLRYKEKQSKRSTKMVGENLEQHCEILFESRRADSFRNAVFKKDNQIINGSKADYIFRDFSDDNLEIVSAIFDMKDETESESKKKKNSDHFKKLDQDRKNKNCDYAILVSLLEPENELYNQGPVEVLDYEKMYVVRPDSFLFIISLLRNFARESLKDKREIEMMKSQYIDVVNFEQNLENAKGKVKINYERASKSYAETIKWIDKAIKYLEDAKSSLLSVDRNLRIANDKAQAITIRSLTSNNPNMAKVFKLIRGNQKDAS